MKPTDENQTSTGGELSQSEIFTATSDVPPKSRMERLGELLDVYIYAPFRVAWNDFRVRIGGSILVAYFLMGTVGVLIIPEPSSLQGPVFIPPLQHPDFPLGTTPLGIGLGRQVVHATPVMFKMMAAGALFSVVVGTTVGTVSGYKGGRIDAILMTITDVVLTIPALALIVVLAAIYTPKNPYVIGFILGIDNWPGLARTLRSQVLSLREQHFVEASRAMGLPKLHIIRRDIVSQLMPYISINMANSSRRIIFESVGLYFIGILPFNTINWGVMMQTAYGSSNLRDVSQLHWLLVPMIAIAFLSFGLVLTAQGLDRVFNVRLRARHAKKSDEEAGMTESDPRD